MRVLVVGGGIGGLSAAIALAQAAALSALDDSEHVARSRKLNTAERARLWRLADRVSRALRHTAIEPVERAGRSRSSG